MKKLIVFILSLVVLFFFLYKSETTNQESSNALESAREQTVSAEESKPKVKRNSTEFRLVNNPHLLDFLHVDSKKLRSPLIISGDATFPVMQVWFNLNLQNFMCETQKKYFTLKHEYRFIESMEKKELSEKELWSRITLKGDITEYSDCSFLDVGAGSCGIVPWLHKHKIKVLGADIWYDPNVEIHDKRHTYGQREFMMMYRETHKDILTLDTNMGDATKLKGIKDESYDFVISHMLFGDLNEESQQKMIENVWRTCKSGGTIRLATDIHYLELEGRDAFKNRIYTYIEQAAKKYPAQFDATIVGLDSWSQRKFREIDKNWQKVYHENLGGDFEPVKVEIEKLKQTESSAFYVEAFDELKFLEAAFKANRPLKRAYTFEVDVHVVLIVINKHK